jgi:benzoyl-CoA reductase subunit BamC
VLVNTAVEPNIIKQIKVDVDKCIGCRACEMACSAFHARPRFSSVNPARARIRVVMDELRDVYVPIRATEYTKAECSGRHTYTIEGKEYDECSFCGASCPARDYFKEPDSGLPLKCDMCEEDPTLDEPWCVKVCRCDALTYEEYVDDRPDAPEPISELELSIESLNDRFGLQKILEAISRMSKTG